jgi:hypothetical protein
MSGAPSPKGCDLGRRPATWVAGEWLRDEGAAHVDHT